MRIDLLIFGVTVLSAFFDILFQTAIMLKRNWCVRGEWTVAQFLMMAGAFSYLMKNALTEAQIHRIYLILLGICCLTCLIFRLLGIRFFRILGAKNALGKGIADLTEKFRQENDLNENRLSIYGDIEGDGIGILVTKDVPETQTRVLIRWIEDLLDKYGYPVYLSCALMILLDIASVVIVLAMF